MQRGSRVGGKDACGKISRAGQGEKPQPRLGDWEAITELGEGSRGCRGLASGSRGVREHGQDKGVFQGWRKGGHLSGLGSRIKGDNRSLPARASVFPQLLACPVGDTT